jgi:putative hydrolase of the HAD superfamily
MNLTSNFLLFDLGGVIIDLDYQKTYDAFLPLLKTGFSSIDQKRIIDEATLPYEQGLISSELFINKLLKFCKPSVHAKQIIDAWNAMLIDIPEERLTWLQQLAIQQPIGILSNTNKLHVQWVNQFLQAEFQTSDLYHYVPNTFYSHDLNDRKPNPSIYRKVAERLSLPTKKILFIDDNLQNVSAALSTGMNALHSPSHIEIMDQLKIL